MSRTTDELLPARVVPATRPAAPEATRTTHPVAAVQRAAAGAALRPAELLSLQRAVGNRAVGRILQAKLSVNAPGDVYEQEADQVARQVVASLSQPAAASPADAAVQREPQGEDEEKLFAKPVLQRDPSSAHDLEDEEPLQLRPIHQLQREGDEAVGPVAPEVESAIGAARGGGSAMDAGVRGQMEGAFGVDFSGVRVHTGPQSDALNQAVQARAFTTGQDIFFRGGEYDPSSSAGKELLAHELTHVVQQNGPALARKLRRDGE